MKSLIQLPPQFIKKYLKNKVMKDTLCYVLIFSLFFTQYVTSAKTTINSNNEHELSTTKELDVAVNSSDCGIPKWYSDLEYFISFFIQQVKKSGKICQRILSTYESTHS